ncbi:putative endo-1,3(4)-beta-glucanase isoform X2 [Canna indica]|uniref:Endo-1,3(4)-beta-glucanase isoform X2 n=1 Tax=Canna indica TaxID=4628 RepID=A0AAQ3QHC6_9LILI|nr:putative endo-1,3(4)-beta-glucanase isoform X2 [Canna indica]
MLSRVRLVVTSGSGELPPQRICAHETGAGEREEGPRGAEGGGLPLEGSQLEEGGGGGEGGFSIGQREHRGRRKKTSPKARTKLSYVYIVSTNGKKGWGDLLLLAHPLHLRLLSADDYRVSMLEGFKYNNIDGELVGRGGFVDDKDEDHSTHLAINKRPQKATVEEN